MLLIKTMVFWSLKSVIQNNELCLLQISSLGIKVFLWALLYPFLWFFIFSLEFWRLMVILKVDHDTRFSSITNYYVNLAWISYIILPNDSWTLANNLIKESKNSLFIFKKCVWRNSTGHSDFINFQVNNSHSVHYITFCLQAKFTPGMFKLWKKSHSERLYLLRNK